MCREVREGVSYSFTVTNFLIWLRGNENGIGVTILEGEKVAERVVVEVNTALHISSGKG
jgi:hypothetical protein